MIILFKNNSTLFRLFCFKKLKASLNQKYNLTNVFLSKNYSNGFFSDCLSAPSDHLFWKQTVQKQTKYPFLHNSLRYTIALVRNILRIITNNK